MVDTISRFRKKYTLTLLLFTAGTVQAFMFKWGAAEYMSFATLLLGVFGTQDLFDKKMPDK